MRFLIDPAWLFSNISSWSCTWFYYQFSTKSTEEWDNSAFFWPEIAWSWKSCEKTWWGTESTAHTRMAEENFRNLIMIYLLVVLFLSALGSFSFFVLWIDSSHQILKKFGLYFIKYFFCTPPSLLFWDLNYTYVRLLDIVPWVTVTLFMFFNLLSFLSLNLDGFYCYVFIHWAFLLQYLKNC